MGKVENLNLSIHMDAYRKENLESLLHYQNKAFLATTINTVIAD